MGGATDETTKELTVLDEVEFASALAIVRTIYAIALVLGFREIAKGVYTLLFEKVSYSLSAPPEPLLFPLGLAWLLTVSFVLRFFWGVENIRRCATRNSAGEATIVVDSISASLSVLLLQAFCVCFMARVSASFVDAMGIDDRAFGFAISATTLLLANAVWLWILDRGREENPEQFWMRNNAFFAAIGTVSIASLYWIGASGGVVLCSISRLFLVNSFLDIRNTGSVYFGLRQGRDLNSTDKPEKSSILAMQVESNLL